MRRSFLASCLLATFAAGCSPAGAPPDARLGEAEERISWGTPDGTAHPAVVALLANAGGGSYTECSGSIVQQKGGYGYVLTAAHCCAEGAPQVVVVGNDYGNAAFALTTGSGLPSGAYAVDAASVRYHASFSLANINAGHDFCMLKFPTSASLSILGLPAAGSDGLGAGTQIEHVGFGTTNTNGSNTVRNKGTDAVSQLDTGLILYQQGGTAASHISGTCQGDSGGPALTPAGAAESQQIVVGVTSFGGADAQGNAVPCGSNDTGGADRVSSEIGTGKFITSFLADTPIGATPGSAPTCDACASGSQGPSGACHAQALACGNDPACITLSQCYGGCTTAACQQTCANTAGQTAVNELNAYSDCVCKTACATPCAASCGGGGSGCGFTSSNAACDGCIQGSCCAAGGACAADATCNGCVTSGGTAAVCKSNQLFQAFNSCLSTKCVGSCVPASSSSSSSGSTSSSSSSSSGSTSSGGTSSSSSGGSTSSGGTGGGGVTPVSNQGGGCSVGPTGSEPASGAGLGGLFLAIALAFRRRRAS
jgi:MYXO-CTERM domain-containing protein